MMHPYYRSMRSSSIVKNISKVYGGDLLSKIFAVGTVLLIIRGLNVGDYAAYTAFWAVSSLIPGLVGSGINLSLVRFSTEYLSIKNQRPFEIYFLSFLFQTILYVITCIILLSLSEKLTPLLFGQKAFGASLGYGLLAGIGSLLIQAGRSIYQAEEKFGTYIKTLLFRQILAFAAIFFLFLAGHLNFHKAAQVLIAVHVGVGAIITLHIFKDFGFHRCIDFFNSRLNVIWDFLSSTGWLIAYIFTLTVFQRLDIFMLSHFSSENELANYGVAFQYYSTSLLLLGSIHAVLLPRFSKIDMQDSLRQREFTLKWLKILFWLIIPISLFDIFGKKLFVWISGAQYERAFYIFIVFSIGIWLSLMFSPLVNVLMSRKAFKFLFTLAVGALILNFSGNYLLIPLWGGVGAAVVTILSHGFINIASSTRVFLLNR